jgi:hypothetical protein
MTYISDELRKQVIQRANRFCEYCRASMKILGIMEIDHIVPVTAEGSTTLDNLCLACRSCNSAKRNYQSGNDPVTHDDVSLFNPRTQVWSEHFAWNDDYIDIQGISAIGRATVLRLDMNNHALVQARRLWRKTGWQPPAIHPE